MEQREFNQMLVRAIEDGAINITTDSSGYIVVKNSWGKIISM